MFKKLLSVITLFIFISCPLFAKALTPQEYFFKAEKLFEAGKYKKAVKLYKKMLKKYPASQDLGQVYYKMGLSYENLEKWKKANETYQTLFQKCPEYPDPQKIIDRQFRIAELFASGEAAGLFGLDTTGAKKFALQVYDQVIKNSPFGPLAEKSLITSIKLNMDLKNFEEAEKKVYAFKKFYDTSLNLDEVSFLHGEIYYLQIKDAAYDQTKAVEATSYFNDYLKDFENGIFRSEVDSRLAFLKELRAEKLLETARFYRHSGKTDIAIKYLQDLITECPETKPIPEAKQLLSQWSDQNSI